MIAAVVAQARDAGGGGALFTLLGAAIAAVAATGGLFVKHVLDSRAEAERHRRAVERLRLELDAKRADQLRDDHRQLVATFLACVMTVYDAVRSARARRRASEIADDAYVRELKAVDGIPGQVALETLRLTADERVLGPAEELWRHLREGDFPNGRDLSGTAWAAWKARFWSLKKAVVHEFSTASGTHVPAPSREEAGGGG